MEPFQLEDWTVEPDLNRIVRNRVRRDLEPRQMDLLVRLARGDGAVVSHRELLRDVWGERFVVEHVVPKTISSLRKALGESARQPRIIRTVSRRGYRIGCPVVRGAATAPPRRALRFEQRRLLKAAALVAGLTPLALTGHSPTGPRDDHVSPTREEIATRVVFRHRVRIVVDTGTGYRYVLDDEGPLESGLDRPLSNRVAE